MRLNSIDVVAKPPNPINIKTAVAEKMSALLTREYLEERAARGDRSMFEAALSRIPNTPATEGDQL